MLTNIRERRTKEPLGWEFLGMLYKYYLIFIVFLGDPFYR